LQGVSDSVVKNDNFCPFNQLNSDSI